MYLNWQHIKSVYIRSTALFFDDVLPAIKSAKRAGMLVCGVYDKYSEHHRIEIEKIADGYLFDWRYAPLPDRGK